ncbi:MAG: hypothetical protein ACM31M_06955 [Nitrososphaerota archaeon]
MSFGFLKLIPPTTPNVIGLDTKAAVEMAMNVVSTTTSRVKRLSMSFIEW